MRLAVFFTRPDVGDFFAALEDADGGAHFLFFCKISAERVYQRGEANIPLAMYLCHAGIFCPRKAASRKKAQTVELAGPRGIIRRLQVKACRRRKRKICGQIITKAAHRDADDGKMMNGMTCKKLQFPEAA